MNKTTEQWLQKKIKKYKRSPTETLEEIITSTTSVMIQYRNNPTSKAAKGVYDSCIEHNKLLINEIGLLIN